jgi:tRNA threonylcarbamoyladenosine biosynthesis protein TsaE
MAESFRLDIPNLAATGEFGRRLAALLFPGAVIALVGPLGAGKTHLVRAVAEGLGIRDGRAVNSPTFVLIQEYDARLPIYHFDAYRLRAVQDFADLGVHEYFSGDGVCFVEWADRVEACLPAEYLRVTISITGETSRRFMVEGRGEPYTRLVQALETAHRAGEQGPSSSARADRPA